MQCGGASSSADARARRSDSGFIPTSFISSFLRAAGVRPDQRA
jgi:hypothetical protein